MKKKWLALVLSGVLCLNFTGCNFGGNTDNSDSDYSAEDALAEYKDSKGKNKKEAENDKKDSKKDKESKKDEDSDNSSDLYLTNEKTKGYTEITMYKSKFMVPDSVAESGKGLDDIVRFMDEDGTYDIKAQYCNNCFNEGDIEDVASSIEEYFLEDYDVVVDIDTDDCLADTEDIKCKYIFPSVDFGGYDGSIAYLCDAGNDALLYVIEDGEVFTDKEKDIILKSLDAYDGDEYTYATDMDSELFELETMEDETEEDETEEDQQDEDDTTSAIDGHPLTAYEMTFEGQTLKLPMWYSDLVDAGWTYEGDENDEMPAHSKYVLKKFTNKDGNVIHADIVNFSINAAPVSDAIITGLEYQKYSLYGNSEDDNVELPEGIKINKSTYDDIVEAYGEPSRVSEIKEDSEFYFVYYEFDYDHKVTFTVDVETNIPYCVEIDCEEELKGVDSEVSSERPDILDDYKAPKKLSDNPYDATFKLDKVVYQLPCPTEVFLENGWKITEGADEPIVPGSWGYGKIKKDGHEYDVKFKSPIKDAVYAKNAVIISIEADDIDGSFAIYDGIAMGEETTMDEIVPFFEGMDVDADAESSSMGLQFVNANSTKDSESKVLYRIVIDNGVIDKIFIENNVRYER